MRTFIVKKNILFTIVSVILCLFLFLINSFGNSYNFKSIDSKYNGVFQIARLINGTNIFPFYEEDLPLIAIIDSGVDTNNKYIVSEKVINIKLNEDISKSIHGTMVAGLFISKGDGINTPLGTLPNSKILSIESGNDEGMSIQQLAKSIRIAVDKGAKIINISAGTPTTSKELEESIEYAITRKVILVAAAGNDGIERNYYPAAFPGVIAVSTLKNNMQIDKNTNYDKNNILSPGNFLLTTYPNSRIGWMNGSSAAAPIVSSLCAIIKSKYPEWNSYMVEKLLLSSGTVIQEKDKPLYILNAQQTLIQAQIISSMFGPPFKKVNDS
ncbi:S8/S53 family peptidase [Bacillaceae bacterium S4-13-58]